MGRTKEGGSVLSFVIIGFIVVVLFVGGVYLVRQQSTSSKPEPTPASDSKEPQKQPNDTADKPSKDESSQPVASRPVELPQTGATEQLGAMLVVGLLTGVGAAYVQSRRLRPSL